MKTELTMKLFDDASVAAKLPFMGKLEVMSDDARNVIPDEYFEFIENIPLGSTVKITFEVLETQSKTLDTLNLNRS